MIRRNSGRQRASSAERRYSGEALTGRAKMFRYGEAMVAALVLLAFASGRAHAEPTNTIRDMWSRFQACLGNAPGGNDSKDSEITIVFALKRDGSLLGRPRIAHSKLVGEPDEQKQFVAHAIASIDNCLPLEITPALGGAIAGRPLALRIFNGRWRTEI